MDEHFSLRDRGPASEENTALVARIAWLYYHKGLTQQAVGDQLGLSRNKVLRMLARAREEGIVQIRVVHPSIRLVELESRLVETFGLREAVVTPTDDSEEKTLEAVGQFGAMYLERTLQVGQVIGTAWGVALREVARQLRPMNLDDVTVLQLMGGLHADGMVNPLDVARVMAAKLGGQARMLYTPAFVDTPAIRHALLSDKGIADTLAAGAHVNTALVGIGDVSVRNSLLRWGVITPEQLEEAAAAGAVGDIVGRFFDPWGRPVATTLANRTVALSLEAVKALPHVVAVVAGRRKAHALLGALRGGFVNVLITDEAAARAALRLHDGPSSSPPRRQS